MTQIEMEQCRSLRYEIESIERAMRSPRSTVVAVFYKDYRSGKGIPKSRQEVDNGEDEPQTNADQHIQSVESVGSNLEPFRVADRKTEPTISKMEQVDKDINVRSKDEPQTERSKE